MSYSESMTTTFGIYNLIELLMAIRGAANENALDSIEIEMTKSERAKRREGKK